MNKLLKKIKLCLNRLLPIYKNMFKMVSIEWFSICKILHPTTITFNCLKENTSIIPENKFKLYRKSQNNNGYINLVLYKDLTKLILNPIFFVQDKLFSPLIFNNLTLNAIDLTEEMLYDILRSPHSFLLHKFIFNKLDNISEETSIKINPYIKFTNNTFVKKPSPHLFPSHLLKPIIGVYAIIDNTDFKYFYIGSSINVKQRYQTHKSRTFSKNIDNFVEVKDLDLNIIYLTRNYLLEFKLLYPSIHLSKGEWVFLNKLTDLHIRILEQSLITGLKPFFNISPSVVYSYSE